MNRQQLEQFSPYSIREVNANPKDILGAFDHFDGGIPHIRINSRILKYQRLATLAHELGHARHYRRHCKCYWSDESYTHSHMIKELHAMKFELAVLLHLRARRSLKWVIGEYSCVSDFSNKATQQALRKLYQTKIYKKCKEFVKE